MSLTPAQIIPIRNPNVTVDARVINMITLATDQNSAVYKTTTQLNTAIALMVLHWLALEAGASQGASGSLIKEKEGQLERSYGKSNDEDGYLGTTSWGRELLQLRRANIFLPRNRKM